MKRASTFFILIAFLSTHSFSQITLNEGSNKNYSQISSVNGSYYDWVELYNGGSTTVNLQSYHLSDDPSQPAKWTFPSVPIAPNSFLVVHASGLGSSSLINHWETAVYDTDTWQYLVPSSAVPASWNLPGFDASGWLTGMGGIGYGDNDDNTVIGPNVYSVYMIDTFQVPDPSKIVAAVLNADYDDGFVAYLNGFEIARSGLSGVPPAWNELATDHEAIMYQGYAPEIFIVDSTTLAGSILPGVNVFAIEVHNTSPFSSDLTARAFLSFGINDNSVFFGPVPPFFSIAASAELHASFQIDADGEIIFFSDPSGNLLDSLLINNLALNYSVGRKPDGSSITGIFTTATPGASNNTSVLYTSYEPVPTISHDAGYYPGTINVSVSTSSSTAFIRYTLDGRIPDNTSPLYTGSVQITDTKVFKARCFSTAGKLPSPPETRTYLIDEDYTLAVISISTNSENLYGAEGIYDNYWTDWKRPSFYEYFDTLHQFVFSGNSSIKIDGGLGGSRSQPQKSFRLEPNDPVMGDSAIHYKIIPARSDRNVYESIYLRNGSNQYLGLMHKDAMMGRLFRHSKTNYQEYTPVVVYLNGQYWGVYELRERQDENYFEENYEVNPGELDLLSLSAYYGGVLRTLAGSDSDFYSMHNQIMNGNAGSPQFYSIADSLLDLGSYADYIIAETWLGNYDWPGNNIKIWRGHNTDNKWRFGVQDVELGLPPNSWSDFTSDLIWYVLTYDPNNPFISPFQKLMQNQQFHDYFIDRYCDLMNTILLFDTIQPICQSMYSELLPELPAYYTTWGYMSVGQHMLNFSVSNSQFLNGVAQRSDYVRQHLLTNLGLTDTVTIELDVYPAGAGRIRISTIRPVSYPWSGLYFNGVPVTITAIAAPGYQFQFWSPSNFIADPLLQSFTSNITNATEFTANFIPTSPPAIVVSEFNYHSEPTIDAGDWVELYNSGSDTVDLFGWYLEDDNNNHRYDFPLGTILEPGKFLVVAEDLQKFQQQHPAVNNMTGSLGFGFSNSNDEIRLFNSMDQPATFISYEDSLPWTMGADGHGRTAELSDMNGMQNDPLNWFDGCIGGSPGMAFAPCLDSIVISEINYNSSSLYPSDDWIELRNISNQPIDIGGWQLMDSNDSNQYVIPSPLMVPPGGNYVLAETLTSFQSVHPSVTNVIGGFGFNLDGGGEWIHLNNASGKIALSVDYNDTLPWPLEADGLGYTCELLDSSGNMNDGNNWFAGCLTGSPGDYFHLPCVVITSDQEIPDVPYFQLQPTISNDDFTLEYSTSESNLICRFYDLAGRIIYEAELPQNGNELIISTSDLAVGLLLASVVSSDHVLRQWKVVVID